jgi:hypothetical protein
MPRKQDMQAIYGGMDAMAKGFALGEKNRQIQAEEDYRKSQDKAIEKYRKESMKLKEDLAKSKMTEAERIKWDITKLSSTENPSEEDMDRIQGMKTRLSAIEAREMQEKVAKLKEVERHNREMELATYGRLSPMQKLAVDIKKREANPNLSRYEQDLTEEMKKDLKRLRKRAEVGEDADVSYKQAYGKGGAKSSGTVRLDEKGNIVSQQMPMSVYNEIQAQKKKSQKSVDVSVRANKILQHMPNMKTSEDRDLFTWAANNPDSPKSQEILNELGISN